MCFENKTTADNGPGDRPPDGGNSTRWRRTRALHFRRRIGWPWPAGVIIRARIRRVAVVRTDDGITIIYRRSEPMTRDRILPTYSRNDPSENNNARAYQISHGRRGRPLVTRKRIPLASPLEREKEYSGTRRYYFIYGRSRYASRPSAFEITVVTRPPLRRFRRPSAYRVNVITKTAPTTSTSFRDEIGAANATFLINSRRSRKRLRTPENYGITRSGSERVKPFCGRFRSWPDTKNSNIPREPRGISLDEQKKIVPSVCPPGEPFVNVVAAEFAAPSRCGWNSFENYRSNWPNRFLAVPVSVRACP